MSKIQDHPVMVTLTIAGTIFTIIAGLALFGQASIELAVGAAALLAIAVAVAWFRAPPKQDAPLPIVQPPAAATSPVQRTPYKVELITALPMANVGQHLYLDAFEAMAKGEIHNWNYCLLVEVGKHVLDWINDHYFRYVQAYPGARGDELKRRFAELAFNRIQSNQLFPHDVAQIVVPIISRYVTDRFAKEY